ncbi:hypothetical protein MLD38_033449 [Melastoma candidum]|uniref:Uncharacterized protein n=1 Tax=Melastoma candidum TaxID=119954 RepID=A0ACB9M7C9_9MYRT|nr:hypothetical protein MLD38_033449 [Melastoma candidum]
MVVPVLNSYSCNFFGLLPRSICNLKNMKYLNIVGSSIGNLLHLIMLDFPNNQLVGMIPPQISNLTQLQTLHLQPDNTLLLLSNRFEGEIPPSISQMKNLEVVVLNHNDLTGTVMLDTFLNLKKLLDLQLSFNQLSIQANTSI